MNDDFTLLQRYAREGDESAFAELVRRHVNLVWGAAHRITQDADLAKDIAQTVFADLARKAKKLPSATIVAGWLYRSSTLAAHTAVRTNTRRLRREELAMTDHSPSQDHDPDATAGSTLQPIVDEAIEALPEADRNAVLLRFFSGKNFAQIGALTGVSDDAAQKRVSRALEKLRAHFLQRGVDVSHGAVAAGLSLAAAHAAPAGAASLFSASAAASAASTSLLMSLASMKTSLLIAGSAAAIAVSTSVAVWEHSQVIVLREENARLALRITKNIPRRMQGPGIGSGIGGPGTAPIQPDMPPAGQILVLRDAATAQREEAARVLESIKGEDKARITQIVEDLKGVCLAARIYATDHQDRFPATFQEMANELGLSPGGTLSHGTPLSQFEFFPQPRPINANEPSFFLFREKAPAELADGRWVRAYSYADGSVTAKVLPTSDFSSFEADGTAQSGRPETIAMAQKPGMDPELLRRYGLAGAGATDAKKSAPKRPEAIAMDPILARRYGLIPRNAADPSTGPGAKSPMESRYGLPAGSLSKPASKAIPQDPPQDDPAASQPK